MQIYKILDKIDDGAIALPEFQRGYVWNRNQVKALVDSLYRRHPVGGLLVWETRTENADARGDGQLQHGSVKLLLDGQQRVTSLYGLIRGKPPQFFDGHADAFTGLYFHLDEERFEFYRANLMDGNPRWVSVTELMQRGAGAWAKDIVADPDLVENFQRYLDRLNAIDGIKNIDFHIEEVTGEDKTVDIVVDIFNRVNSGGTKLSKGDLALAKVCAEWPPARDALKARLKKWREAGFHFKLDWLLRCVVTVTTGEAYFHALEDVTPQQFREGLERAERAIDTLLNLVGSRLGLDHDRVLGSRYSFPLLARYLSERDFHLGDAAERDRLLYWYVHTFLWGRYAGSTESKLSQDLTHLHEAAPDGEEGDALDRLIGQLRRDRGDLRVRPEDFHGWSRGARFYPLMYMLTRTSQARDWGSGIELKGNLLGKLSRLEVHHVFPKALLYKHDYSRAEVNALANFTFLTQDTNLQISDRTPAEYFEEIEAKHPGALASHWIPQERALWHEERYPDFLAARQVLLAEAANEFLRDLAGDIHDASAGVGDAASEAPVAVAAAPSALGAIATEEEEQLLLDAASWVVGRGLPEGELLYEVADEESGEPLVVLDLAWPDGLQPGLSPPVALLLGEGPETLTAAQAAGFRYFTDPARFREYVREEILAEAMEAEATEA